MRTTMAWIFASLLLVPLAAAQQVTQIQITKDPTGTESRTRIELYIPADVSNLDFNNPINAERTRLAVAKDDAGGDLLATHDAANAEWVAQGYQTELPISFAGVADYASHKDINIGVALKAAPNSGAKAITLEGTIALNFIDVSSTEQTVLTAIPTETEWGSPGTDTPIGPVRIEPAASMHMGDIRYQGYQVVSPNAPVIAAAVVGGDASEEVHGLGMALEPGVFFLKGEPPQNVDLNITYAATEIKEFPFKLTFGVGL